MSQHALVLQSDFGLDDGAVNAMYGVAYSVDSSIRIFDLTHNIPVFHICEASYRLLQSVSYWPEGTVFVSVVDPGSAQNAAASQSEPLPINISSHQTTEHSPTSAGKMELPRRAILMKRKTGFKIRRITYIPWTRHLRLHRGNTGSRRSQLRQDRSGSFYRFHRQTAGHGSVHRK